MKTKPWGLILAGGQSLRLYPLSTPKPLLRLAGKSLLEQALERLKGFDTSVVVNSTIASQIRLDFRKRKLKSPSFLIEPEGRDTAAAVGFGLRESLQKKRLSPSSWMAVLSADQWMPKASDFSTFLKKVEQEIRKFPDSLFVCGSPANSKPLPSHSQFGWILREKEAGLSSGVISFREKPSGSDLENIRKSEGLINAGMFYGRVDTFLKAYQSLYPEVLRSRCRYKNLPRLPIDKAIFEKFPSVRVIELPYQWEDLGTWEDWYSHAPTLHPSSQKETKVHAARSVRVSRSPSSEAQKSRLLAITSSLKEIFVVGLGDLAVIEDQGRLLILSLSEARHLKKHLQGEKTE